MREISKNKSGEMEFSKRGFVQGLTSKRVTVSHIWTWVWRSWRTVKASTKDEATKHTVAEWTCIATVSDASAPLDGCSVTSVRATHISTVEQLALRSDMARPSASNATVYNGKADSSYCRKWVTLAQLCYTTGWLNALSELCGEKPNTSICYSSSAFSHKCR